MQLMKCAEVAQYLRCSEHHVRRLTSRQLIPVIKTSYKKALYDKDQIDKWLLRCTISERRAHHFKGN